MEFKEFTAKTVDDAITNACLELGTSSDNLEIEVVREATSGFFGIGSKPAIIKVHKKVEEKEIDILEEIRKEESKIQKKEFVKKEPKREPKKEFKKEPKKENRKKETKPQEKKEVKIPKAAPAKEAPKSSKEPEKEVEKETAAAPQKPEPKKEVKKEIKKEEKKQVVRTEEQIAAIKAAATEFLTNVFQAMELPVELTVAYEKDSDCLSASFEGEDMGILIGKRGQTLDSLQYLTSLVVNKNQQDYVRVKLDTENYRSRRKDTLENLAKNIAYKVKRTRKAVVLEPMNPYERRIIHSALQGNKFVETYSEGTEPYRHVVVVYKGK